MPTTIHITSIEEAGQTKSDFSKSELAELRSDMRRTLLPSKLKSPPRNFGCKSHGKLKADEWFILVIISAPITFIRLFAGLQLNDRKRELLVHFMELSCALALAARHTHTDNSIEEFKSRVQRYVGQIPTLFPDKRSLVPNHHMALHVADCIRDFGPLQSITAYSYERLNGRLQRLTTNSQTRT